MPVYASNTKRHNLTVVPFSAYTKAILGKDYELSVTCVTPAKMKSLNKKHRSKNTSTDILSFSLGRYSGELYLSVPDIKKKALALGMEIDSYTKFLAIHGMVHLLGNDHGKKMTTLEKSFCKKFKIPHYNP